LTDQASTPQHMPHVSRIETNLPADLRLADTMLVQLDNLYSQLLGQSWEALVDAPAVQYGQHGRPADTKLTSYLP
jgi:hypothetical protein